MDRFPPNFGTFLFTRPFSEIIESHHQEIKGTNPWTDQGIRGFWHITRKHGVLLPPNQQLGYIQRIRVTIIPEYDPEEVAAENQDSNRHPVVEAAIPLSSIPVAELTRELGEC